MNGQLVLPCCSEQAIPESLEWMARACPLTAEELLLVRQGIRIARFVPDEECNRCQCGPMDHRLNGYYTTKVCLMDLWRRGLWSPRPEDYCRDDAPYVPLGVRLRSEVKTEECDGCRYYGMNHDVANYAGCDCHTEICLTDLWRVRPWETPPRWSVGPGNPEYCEWPRH